MSSRSRHQIWFGRCPAVDDDFNALKHLDHDEEPNCPDCGAINPDHPVHKASASSTRNTDVIDLTESPAGTPENPRRRIGTPVSRVPPGLGPRVSDTRADNPIRPRQSERPGRADVSIKEDETESSNTAAPSFVGRPRPLAAPVPTPRPQEPVRPQLATRPQQPARLGEAAMGRAIVQRARTGAFQERAQREQGYHHGGHPRSTDTPNALVKTAKAKEVKAGEQERIDSEGLFIHVTIYECRWRQITLRGENYAWEQTKKEKLTGEGMDYGSVYIQWDTPIRGWEEYILQHILPQTPQWKHNPRVHNNIESLGLGVKTVGKGGSQIVGASLGLETARTTNEFLSYFPEIKQTKTMIITINRTIIKDDLQTSLSEDERAEYAAYNTNPTRTPTKPSRKESRSQASSIIKCESKIKIPQKKVSRELSTPTTAKKILPKKSTTLRRQVQKAKSPSASSSPLIQPSDPFSMVDDIVGLSPMIPLTPPPQSMRAQNTPPPPTVSPITPPGVQTRAQARRKATSELRDSA